MLIACKCLNVMLGPAIADADDEDAAIGRRPPAFGPKPALERNGDAAPESGVQQPFVSRTALERLTADQANFFKAVSLQSARARSNLRSFGVGSGSGGWAKGGRAQRTGHPFLRRCRMHAKHSQQTTQSKATAPTQPLLLRMEYI